MLPDPAELLVRVARTLDAQGIPYLVGGSLASSVYGLQRTTADMDLVVDLRLAQIEALAGALEGEYYVSREAMREAVHTRGAFNAIHLETSYKVDFFVLGTAAFDREEFRRRIPQAIGERDSAPVLFKTPEDVILRKLQWFRSGGEVSEQQWRDVLGVLAVSRGTLDEAYLDRWAAEIGVGDLLTRARKEAANS
jgi:hypothetical protein